ncbi:MAG: RNA polymerase sigma factor [Gammaproteobacteria bacterium]
MSEPAYQAAHAAARDAYGRLIATLCRRGHDVAQAEDALATAFERALTRWPTDGVPDVPAAWLLTTARRVLIDQARHRGVEHDTAVALLPLVEGVSTKEATTDRRLALMVLCAHPDIHPNARAPLMLQTVLGLNARQMSTAFVVSPAALGQRLARAKRAIRDRAIPFELTGTEALSERLGDVLDAIYASFSTGWDDATGARDERHGLAGEALWLGHIVCTQAPREPEALGLLALMLFSQARVDARRDNERYVPLSEQDRDRWQWSRIEQAERCLARAATLNDIGRFQLEAAIQSHHVRTPAGEAPNWEAIALLYEGLHRLAPTLAVSVGRAAALGAARGPAAGLAALAVLPRNAVKSFQPYFAVKAHLHAAAGQTDRALDDYRRAQGLSDDPAVRQFLVRKQRQLNSS